MKKRNYIWNMIFYIINIISGALSAFLSFLVPINTIQASRNGENYFIMLILGLLIVYCYLYSYIKELIRYCINKKYEISYKGDKIATLIFAISSGILLYLISRYREIEETGEVLSIGVSILVFVFLRIKCSIIEKSGFFDLLLQQQKIKEDLKKEKKNQLQSIIIGGICGIFSSIPLLIMYLGIINNINGIVERIDGYALVIMPIIGAIVILYIYDCIYNKINENYYNKHLNKGINNYWILKDVGVYSFKLFSSISYFIVLSLVIKIPTFISIIIVWIAKIINGFILKKGYDLDLKSFGSYKFPSYNEKNNDNENGVDLNFSTSYITDSFGNVIGKAETSTYNSKYGNFETTVYKDNLGRTTGKRETTKF